MRKLSLRTILSFLILSISLPIAFGPFAAYGGTGAQLAEQFLAKKPVKAADPNITMEQAMKAQEEFIGLISKEFGEPVGYKAGLTNPFVQKALGVSQPVRGTMLKKMILPNGSSVPADFAGVPVFEGDLIVRVGDDAINQAKTPEEAMKSLDAVIPFTELADLVFDKGVKLTAPAIVSINVGARCGIMGTPIPLTDSDDWAERLKSFTVRIIDERGTVLSEGKGAMLLGDPLNAALWIKNSLLAEGKRLKKGDLLSLGSLSRPMPSRPGMTVRSIYTGLDPKGPVEVSVSFK